MRALTAPRRGRRHGPIIICGRENVVSAVRCELALETPPRVQPLTRWADQPLPSAKALFVPAQGVWYSSVNRTAAPAVVHSGARISVKALGGGPRGPRCRLLGSWNAPCAETKIDDTRGFIPSTLSKAAGMSTPASQPPELSRPSQVHRTARRTALSILKSSACKIAHGLVATSYCRRSFPVDAFGQASCQLFIRLLDELLELQGRQ